MGLELFLPNSPGLMNSGFGIYLPVACFVAYLVSGHSGIYSAQRIGMPKIDSPDVLPETPLAWLAKSAGWLTSSRFAVTAPPRPRGP